MEDYLLAFRSELEYDAAADAVTALSVIIGTASDGRPVQVSLLVEGQASVGLSPVSAVGLRTKGVEDCLLAFRSELEYDAAPRGTDVLVVGRAAPKGRSIQVPLPVED